MIEYDNDYDAAFGLRFFADEADRPVFESNSGPATVMLKHKADFSARRTGIENLNVESDVFQ